MANYDQTSKNVPKATDPRIDVRIDKSMRNNGQFTPG